MDNYYQGCPPMMNDGRGLTDYRSSQVREERFKYKYNIYNDHDTRSLRTENGEKIMINEWNSIKMRRACFPKKNCFHVNPTTSVTSTYNNSEILAYNGVLPQPKCDYDNTDIDYRMTLFDSVNKKNNENKISGYDIYPVDRRPIKNKINKVLPERTRDDDIH